MKNTYTSIFLLIISSSLYGCYDVMTNWQLSITNKADKNISVLYTNHSHEAENNIAYYTSTQNIIMPDSSYDIITLGGKNAWHEYIKAGKTKTLYIYVFSVDTLKKYDESSSIYEIVDQHKYLKLLSYTEADLNKISWHIVFK